MAKQNTPKIDTGFVADDDGFIADPPQQSPGNWLLQNVAKPAVATPLDMVTGAVQGGIDLANLIPGVHMPPGLDLAKAAGVGGNRGDDLIKNLSSYIPTASASELAAPLSATQGFGPLMAKLGTEGALYQTSQTPDEPGKVALASALNMGIPASIIGGGLGINKLAEYFAAPGMAKNIVSPIMDLKNLKNSDAFTDISNNLDANEKVEKKTWKDVIKSARYYDNNILNRANNKSTDPGISTQEIYPIPQNPQISMDAENLNFPSKSLEPSFLSASTELTPRGPTSLDNYDSKIPPDYIEGEFKDVPSEGKISNPKPSILDTSSYVNPILQKIKEYQALADNHSGYSNSYSGPIDTLKKYLNKNDVKGLVSDDELSTYGKDQYSTFNDALNQNRALNTDYKSTAKPNSGVLKTQEELKATNFARDQLHNMIQENLDKYGLSDTLGKDWMNARNLTRDQANIFKTSPDIKGNSKISDFYGNYLSNNPYADPSRFISQYIPKGEGTKSMEQFSAMVGNKDKATDYLKSNIFKDVMAGNKPDISKFVNITQKDLSPDQINYLFNPNQQEQIKLLSKINDKYPTQFPDAWKSLATGAVAGLAGFSAHPGLAIAGASGPAAYNLAYRGASSPAISGRVQNAMLARMRGESPVMGQTPVNLSRSLIAANQSGGNQ